MNTPKNIVYLLSISCLVLILVSTPVRAEGNTAQFNSVEMAPLSAVSLGDVALVSSKVLKRLGVRTSHAAELSSGEHRIEVLLYPIDRPEDQISMKKSLRDRLGIQPGEAKVLLRLLDPSEQTLEAMESEIRFEPHAGTPEQWPGIVVGAPHGDCDMFTGEIVERTTKLCGVPSVCAYGSRITFLGRWIDVNRPLQRRPNPTSYGILSYRDWTEEATAIFMKFRGNVLQVVKQSDLAAGAVPARLYLDFHGHDLSVKAADGERIYRNVFECMARGFNQEEVRALKVAYDQCVQEEYGDEAPPSYWGNLPEDREYEFAGLPASFYYSGLGGRVYGTLASNLARRAVHIESPDSMRMDPAHRPRTARVLSHFLQVIRDEILPKSLARQSVVPPASTDNRSEEWAKVAAGDFLQGAPKGEGWSVEWPQHWVDLSAYEMRTTEVTCGEFAAFINGALAAGQAEIRDDEVYDKTTGKRWCLLWPKGVLSMLRQENGKITWREGRENHPVNYVTWHGAMAMAKATGTSLPTEAQWEKAAGWEAKTRRPYRTGMSLPRFWPEVQAAMMNSGHASENYVAPSTSPVGSFSESRSPVGCYDMSGNVWEWTTDWFGSYADTSAPLRDPIGPTEGSMKVVRGGGWDTERSTATPSFRLGVSPDQTLPNVGFRLSRPSTD